MLAAGEYKQVGDTYPVAILPWGDAIEEFLSPLGLDAHTYLQKADGGWLFGYVAALQAAGFTPVILWGSDAVAAPERLVHPATGAAIWLFPAHQRPKARPEAWISLQRWWQTPVAAVEHLLRLEGCRAIIAQEYEDARFDRWVRLAQKIGIPVFASFQGGDRTASWLEARVRPSSIGRAAGFIVPSAAERQRIQARYGRHLPPLSDIPNPIDVHRWTAIDRAEARRKLSLEPSTFVAINHGRIDVHRKGLDVLLAAWAKIQRDEDRLVIIGSGQDDAAFATLLRERETCGIDWHAAYSTDRDHIRTWLSAADIYVTASRIEGMPVAPLEAMSCGLPIVATDAQGLADILQGGEEHGGLLVRKDDPSALATAIARLRDDEGLRGRLGRAARRRVETTFSLETVSSALAGLLQRPGADL